MKRLKLYLCLVALSLTDHAIAAQDKVYEVKCPKQIYASSQLSSQHPGWRTLLGVNNHDWIGVAMYTDEPEKLAELKPESSSDGARAVWSFSTREQGYTVCEYQFTTIRLTQPLHKNTTRCTAYYDKYVQSDKGPIPKRVLCVKS